MSFYSGTIKANVLKVEGGNPGVFTEDYKQRMNNCVDGLNFFGYCQNEECSAFKKEIVCGHGMKTVLIKDEEDSIKCPICHTKFPIHSFLFKNCIFNIVSDKKKNIIKVESCQGFTYVNNLDKEFKNLKVQCCKLNRDIFKTIDVIRSVTGDSMP